jgi:hypothetical protein
MKAVPPPAPPAGASHEHWKLYHAEHEVYTAWVKAAMESTEARVKRGIALLACVFMTGYALGWILRGFW